MTAWVKKPVRPGQRRPPLRKELPSRRGPLFAQLHFATDVAIEIAEPPAREAFQMF